MRKLVFFLCIFFTTALNAADYRGKVVYSEDEKPVFGATVQLLDTLSFAKYGDKTNKSGEFKLKNVKDGKYTLRISYVGYKSVEFKYVLSKKSAANFGEFKLEVGEVQTGDVVVESEAILGEMVGDTAQYNAQAVKVAPDAMLVDLLSKMPGIQITSEGAVKAQGKEVSTVLVDGKEFFDGSTTTAIENIPANVVDKVQVYDKNDKEIEFSGRKGTKDQKGMNILLQEDKKVGFFGSLFGAYGTEDYYGVSGAANYMNGDERVSAMIYNNNNDKVMPAGLIFEAMGPFSALGLYGRNSSVGDQISASGGAPIYNISQGDGVLKMTGAGASWANSYGKWLDLTVFYGLTKEENESSSETIRDYFLGENADQKYNQDGHGKIDGMTHTANMQFEANIDSANRMSVYPSLRYGDNDVESYSTTTNQYKDGKKINAARTDFFSNSKETNFNNNLYYAHEFAKKGRRFGISMHNNFAESDGYAMQKGVIDYLIDGTSDTLNQRTDLYSKDMKINLKADASEPLTDYQTLEFMYEFTNDNGTENRQANIFDPLEREYSLLDTAMSSNFETNDLKHELQLAYQLQIGEIMNTNCIIDAKLNYRYRKITAERMMPLAYNVEYSTARLLPFLSARMKLSGGFSAYANYKLESETPTVSDLNEVVNNSNPLLLCVGDRNLKEAKTHNINLGMGYQSDDFKTHISLSGGLNFTDDYIGTNFFTATRDTIVCDVPLKTGAQVMRPVNLGGYFNANSSLICQFPLPGNLFSGMLSGNASYTELPGIINWQETITKSNRYSANMSLSSKFSWDFKFSLKGGYSYNRSVNPQRESADAYHTLRYTIDLDWKFLAGLYLKGSFTNNYYFGMYYDDGDFNTHILDLEIGYKMLANDALKLSLKCNDVLNTSNGITNTIGTYYNEFARKTIVPRYFMFSATWKFNTLGKSKPQDFIDFTN